MLRHPESERLARSVERCVRYRISWSGEVYRAASVRYATKDDLLTGVGSKAAGARWNPPRSFRTVYTSTDPHTALDEVLAHYRHYHIPISRAMPQVLVAVRVRLRQVLDLHSGFIRRALRVSADRMRAEPWREMQDQGWEALTQAIGRVAWEAGWEGVRVPVAGRGEGANLVIFPANLKLGSGLEIVNVADLPPILPIRE